MKKLLLPKKYFLLFSLCITKPALPSALTRGMHALPDILRHDAFGYAVMGLGMYYKGKAQPSASPVKIGGKEVIKQGLSRSANVWLALGVASFTLRRWDCYKKTYQPDLFILKYSEALMKRLWATKERTPEQPILPVSTAKKADEEPNNTSGSAQTSPVTVDCKV